MKLGDGGKMIGPILKRWRAERGMSQLDLALAADVSARHVSFLETGRSRPSPDMVLRLVEALGLPLRERNAVLIAAGYMPRFGESRWDSTELCELRRAARLILTTHDPYPAFVLDGLFTILDANTSATALMDAAGAVPGANLVDLVFQPGPIRQMIVNWDAVANYFLHRLREGARLHGSNAPVAQKLRQALAAPGAGGLVPAAPGVTPSVLLKVILNSGDGERAWFTTLTSFGAPLDALAEEIIIEQFHPAE
jgi:transcriptional regulator with XRE-family HTH domain